MKRTTSNDGFELPQVKNNQNIHLFPKHPQGDFGPSVTVPDQAMSVKEILDRFARGLPLGGVRVPVWDGEEEVPDFRKMDLADVETFMRENKQEIEYLQKELEALEAQKSKLEEKQAPAGPPAALPAPEPAPVG